MELDFLAVEERVKEGYRPITEQYRRDDEIEVKTDNHQRLTRLLQAICRSFPEPITVLDAGCGTGRYFHCLQHVRCLTGLDISEEMLGAARHPVREELIEIERIELRRGNIHLIEFPSNTFDLIYSLGMFGHGCPVTVEVCNKFHSWLKPAGQLLFNVVDFDGLNRGYRYRQRLRSLVYPWLPRSLQMRLDRRAAASPFFGLCRPELMGRLKQSRFKEYSVISQPCRSPLWSGRHLECVAFKTPFVVPANQERAEQQNVLVRRTA